MLITCVFYVFTWEIMYFKFMPDFMDKYSAYEVAKMQASGASAAAVQAQIQQLKHYTELYNHVLYNSAMTFLEPLPVGLLITLVSAAILRKKTQAQTTQTMVEASS